MVSPPTPSVPSTSSSTSPRNIPVAPPPSATVQEVQVFFRDCFLAFVPTLSQEEAEARAGKLRVGGVGLYAYPAKSFSYVFGADGRAIHRVVNSEEYSQSHFGRLLDTSRKSLSSWLQEIISGNSGPTQKKKSSQSHTPSRPSPPSYLSSTNSPPVTEPSNQQSNQKNSRSETQKLQQHPGHHGETRTWQPHNGVRIRR